MATAQAIVEAALRKAGVHNPTQAELDDGLVTLNDLLSSWGPSKLMTHFDTLETFSMVASQSTYTIGSGGDFDTTRPSKIIKAYVRDSSNTDYQVDIVDKNLYHNYPLKTTEGRPNALFYATEWTLAKIYLYPTPDSTETLVLLTRKPIAELASLTASVSLPNEYKRGLVTNLLLDICGDYGYEPSRNDVVIARDAKAAIMRQNVRPLIMELDGALVRTRITDINSIE